jgi:hypothetical protein
VLSYVDSYPQGKWERGLILPKRLWGGNSQFILHYSSVLLGANVEGVVPHIAYWEKKNLTEFMHLLYLIGPSAKTSGHGTSKHFTSCHTFSFRQMRAAFSVKNSDDSINNILNVTYDGSHYFPSSIDVTADFMTETLNKAWDLLTAEINRAIHIPTQPILSVVVGTRVGQTRGSTIASGKLSSLSFSVDNSSASRADFSQQSFSHLDCNVPPFVGIINAHAAQAAYQTSFSSASKRSRTGQTHSSTITHHFSPLQPTSAPFIGIINHYQTTSASKPP